VHRQAVRRGLEHDRIDASVTHGGQQTLDDERLGRRLARLVQLDLAGDAHLDGADQSGSSSVSSQHRLDQMARGRLTVRAGDADNGQAIVG